jgi:hypothetical protein
MGDPGGGAVRRAHQPNEATESTEPVNRPLFLICLVAGWAVIAFGLHGLISDPGPGKPVDTLRTLVLLNIANDALVVPVLIGAAILARRVLPSWAVTGVQVGVMASAVVLLFAYPLLGDWARTARAGYSRLPWNYAHNVGIVLGGIWLVAACIVVWTRRRMRQTGPHPTSAGTSDVDDALD